MNHGLYTNRGSRSDFIINAFYHFAKSGSSLKIASAFFTDEKTIDEILKRECTVRLVIRLGFPTSPKALRSIVTKENVQIRYFTDKSFHSKLYIFGDRAALIGSANLTKAAFLSNQEIMMVVPMEDPRFDELAVLFNEYWEDAKVLTSKDIDEYESIYNSYDAASSSIYNMDENVIKHFGKVVSHNIRRDKEKVSKEDVFLEDYRKTYQESLSAFNVIRDCYNNIGKRKIPKDCVPLRIEIDSFISFVRDKHAQGDKWFQAPIIEGEEKKDLINKLIEKWHYTPWPYFEKNIVEENYPRILEVFSSKDSIKSSSNDTLFSALCVIHSFVERLRFYPGGLPTLKEEFFSKNERNKINNSLSYLIFGKDDIIQRMCNLIFVGEYKLNEFGRANVQELIGWLNKEELPVINGRTTKVLRYFGFDIRQS